MSKEIEEQNDISVYVKCEFIGKMSTQTWLTSVILRLRHIQCIFLCPVSIIVNQRGL